VELTRKGQDGFDLHLGSATLYLKREDLAELQHCVLCVLRGVSADNWDGAMWKARKGVGVWCEEEGLAPGMFSLWVATGFVNAPVWYGSRKEFQRLWLLLDNAPAP
jgi:hypothetical protein